MKILNRTAVLCIALMVLPQTLFADVTYQSEQEFLQEIFSEQVPDAHSLWLRGDVKDQVNRILDHAYNSLRIRYWVIGNRSAWILDEIGKERPITTGIVIQNGKIDRLRILVYRESRGAEVRHDFFTSQFRGALLNADRNLDRKIDGITGATLSVRALKRLARLALYLDSVIHHPT